MTISNISDARSPLSYARRYARMGWHVIPLWWAEQVEDGKWRCACGSGVCAAPAKHPISAAARQGQNSASVDETQIEHWWTQYPRANIGVVLAPSHLVAIDIDPRNGGDATIGEVERGHGLLRSDVLQLTGGGGEHRVFQVPAGVMIQVPGKLGPGVDVKHNGYIVVEPSNHITGGTYRWEASSDPLDGVLPSVLPDWVRSVRPDHLPQEPQNKVLSPAEVIELQSALAVIDPDGRETWLNVGMALHATEAGQQAYGIWVDWSRQSTKFDSVDQQRVWRSFRGKGLGGLTVAWIFATAQASGWVNPRSRMAQQYARAPIEISAEDVVDQVVAQEPAAQSVPEHLTTIPGRLGDAVAWINATARKPQPLLAVQAALALGSTITGRRYRTTNGNWPMLYLLNVAQSGAGKEHGKYAVETLLEATGLHALIGAGRFASESGVLSALIEKPSQFCALDEFGKMLQSAAVAQNYADRNTLKFLMEVWGRADGVVRPVAYSTAGMSSKQAEDLARRVVRKPSLTLMAMTTPETLYAGVTTAAVSDGFLPRILTVHADRGRQMTRMVEPIDPPQRLIEWMQSAHLGPAREGNLVAAGVAHDMEPSPIVMDFDAGARAVFRQLEERMLELADSLDAEGLAEIAQRVTETAMRVALIVSISLEADRVTVQAAQWASDYVEVHTRRNLEVLRDRMSDGPFDQLCKEIRRLVVNGGARGMTERDLDKASRVFRASPERMRADALASLQRREEITLADIASTGGRGRKRRAFISSDLLKIADNADKSGTHVSAN